MYNNINLMTTLIPEFQAFKDKIPEFIIKLYHILESNQYNEYLCWSEDGQVLIRNGKKLEEKVLPHFFRHRHLSSFIRQLNMYKFSKVHKIIKEKNYMYFRNDHFRRGQIKEMMKIKRNIKKNRAEKNHDQLQSQMGESQLSINKQLANNALLAYKQYVKTSARVIIENLKKIETNFPQTKLQMQTALNLCNELIENQQLPQMQQSVQLGIQDNAQNKNMLSTMRLVPRLQSLIFPSQCSFYHFS